LMGYGNHSRWCQDMRSSLSIMKAIVWSYYIDLSHTLALQVDF